MKMRLFYILAAVCCLFRVGFSDTETKAPLPSIDLQKNTPLREIYVMPTPSTRSDFKIRDAITAANDFSNLDLRGLYLDVDVVEEGLILFASFENSDLTGFTTSINTEFHSASFKSAILRDTFLGGVTHECDFTDAEIQGNAGYGDVRDSRNYKKKDLSGAVISVTGNYDSFNLSYSHICVDQVFWPSYQDANITGAVILGYDFRGREKTRKAFPYLLQTQNYKERNLGSVVFINLDLEDMDLSRQTLGYFDCCDLSKVNLENAYFHAKDEQAITPFSRVIPGGFTACKISMEQFRTTRNYKIWQANGIPAIVKIRVTPDNARFYNFKIVDGKVIPKDYDKLEWEQKPTEEVFVYKVGNIHVTEEIAAALEVEKEQP